MVMVAVMALFTSKKLHPVVLAGCALEFCRAIEPNIRIDTHADNAPMLGLIERAGFERCGIIYHTDGTPRIAFQAPPDMR